MEAVYAALIALGSAVIVKVLDYAFTRKSKSDQVLAEIRQDIKQTQADVKSLREEMLEDQANLRRQRILRFSDDLLHGQDHQKEYYDAILQDITEYDLYCSTHVDFRNSVTSQAAKNILKNYDSHMWEKDFLQ